MVWWPVIAALYEMNYLLDFDSDGFVSMISTKVLSASSTLDSSVSC
jgi:hypothetical protein